MKRTNLIALNLQHFAESKPEPKADPQPEVTGEGSKETPIEDPKPEGATLETPIGPKPKPEPPKEPTLEDLQAKIAELTAANASLHKNANKASTEAADWRKKYQSMLSVDEQKAQAEKEQKELFESMKRELAVIKDASALMKNGFSEDEAKAISEARYSGDIDTAISLENKHYENIRQQLEADYKKKLTELTRPASGNGEANYQQVYEKAMQEGNTTGAIAALLKQAGMTIT